MYVSGSHFFLSVRASACGSRLRYRGKYRGPPSNSQNGSSSPTSSNFLDVRRSNSMSEAPLQEVRGVERVQLPVTPGEPDNVCQMRAERNMNRPVSCETGGLRGSRNQRRSSLCALILRPDLHRTSSSKIQGFGRHRSVAQCPHKRLGP